MGQSTDGQICFGVLFDEGFEFPWDDDKWDGDQEEWWRVTCGFKPTFYPYNDEGNYADGVEEGDPRIDKYLKEQDDFDKTHPFPIEVVNYCSGDCPMYILAVKSSSRTANRGYPEEFDPEKLCVSDGEVSGLTDFVTTHIARKFKKPRWYLSSYWG